MIAKTTSSSSSTPDFVDGLSTRSGGISPSHARLAPLKECWEFWKVNAHATTSSVLKAKNALKVGALLQMSVREMEIVLRGSSVQEVNLSTSAS